VNQTESKDSPKALSAVCVFCGAQSGARPEYLLAARALGTLLAQRQVTLIYGGGHVGMMGALADAALGAGGRVMGVIPKHLMQPEAAHPTLTELHVVESMHARKQWMASHADAFIVLPGGYGTLEELFEMTTWLQLNIQAKPIGLVNVAGFFDPLLAFLRHVYEQGFIRDAHRDLLIVEPTVSLAFERLILHADTVRRTHPQTGDLSQG